MATAANTCTWYDKYLGVCLTRYRSKIKMQQQDIPILTPQMAQRIEHCDTAYIASRLHALSKLDGNPYDVEVRQYGSATALMARGTKNSLFNRVADITSSDTKYIDEIVAWYRENHIKCRFDVVPSQTSPELLRHLAKKGFYQSSFYIALYGVPNSNSPNTPNIVVRPVEISERDVFVNMYIDGFEFPKASSEFLRDNIHAFFDEPDAHFFFALVDNTLAGIGILFLSEKVGYLASAATLPAFRGHGCQKALLQARITAASAAECDLVVGHTSIATISQYNMEKMGLRVAYTKAIWTELT